MVQYDKLFAKLKVYSITGVPLEWLVNLFTNCTNGTIHINRKHLLSDVRNLIADVIQGSVIGTLILRSCCIVCSL